MKQEWRLYTKNADFYALADELNVSPMLVRLMRNRDLTTLEEMRRYLYAGFPDLYDPYLMKGMKEAVELILRLKVAGDADKKVAISTDYDCDGIFSGYILKQGLTMLGFDAKLYTPDRTTEGYGLNKRIVDEAISDGKNLLITCDNGIASVDEAAYARDLGMRVIITDHHEPQETLPSADVILDPKQENETYPFDGLCGAGVAYKFICALFDECHIDPAEKERLLPYVAIATVADVMELRDENRILVKLGLKKLESTDNKGLKELLTLQSLSEKPINSGHISFVIGPCFNSAGRISSVSESFDVLFADTDEKALMAATKLKSINDERKDMTEKGTELILEDLSRMYPKGDDPDSFLVDDDRLPDVLVLYAKDIHESLAGIVASKVKERFNHPVIIFAKADTDSDEPLIKGSGRSISSYNMFENLMKCKDLMVRFGGHAMACGMTIRESDFETFSKRLNENSGLSPDDFISLLHIDIAMPIAAQTEEFIEELGALSPMGTGNPGPVFAEKGLKLIGINYMGSEKQHLKLYLLGKGDVKRYAVAFGAADDFKRFALEKFGEEELKKAESFKPNDIRLDIAYVPEINEYNGKRSIQLKLKAWK